MVLPRKRLGTALLRADKWSFLVVATHVRFETAWPVESLAAAVDFAHKVPLAASLAICPPGSIVGEIYFLVRGIF